MSQSSNYKSMVNRFFWLAAGLIGICGWLINHRTFELEHSYTLEICRSILKNPELNYIFLDTTQGVFLHFILFLLVSYGGVYSGTKNKPKIPLLAIPAIVVVHFIAIICGYPLGSLFSLTFVLWLAYTAGKFLKELDHYEAMVEVQKDTIDESAKELANAQLKIIRADEIDRRVLAGDLHDQVLHGLKMVRQKIHNYHKAPSDKAFEEIDQGIARSMDEIREVMDSLSPSSLENLGFAEAIEEIIRKGSAQRDFRVRFRSDVEENDFEKLTTIEKTLLYRIVQESVNNIIKHAEASKVRCLISKREGKLHITIADNGKGFDTSVLKTESRGVQYMLQRASIINATIDWRPAEKGDGTVVDVSI